MYYKKTWTIPTFANKTPLETIARTPLHTNKGNKSKRFDERGIL
jgi:hypothetical protein